MSETAPRLPIVHISTMGNLANQMIQVMAAKTLAARLGGCVLSNINLPIWRLFAPLCDMQGKKTLIVQDDRLDFDRLAELLRSGEVDVVDIRSYAQCMDNFLGRDVYNELFACPGYHVPGFGAGDLLCSIRGGDVLDGHHRDYTQIPADFYEMVQKQTGLRLVFMGQIGDNRYIADLRRRFPEALYLQSAGALRDFEMIRRSTNIIPSISTFAWLASWLSDARNIFMPVSGIFHPVQSPTIDLLPMDEHRYHFYLFPVNYAVPIEEYEAVHAALGGHFRLMQPSALRELFGNTPRFNRDKQDYLDAFDEEFYLGRYPEVRESLARGFMPTGRSHFEHHGYEEGREAFPLDPIWYTTQYPLAALEAGQGDYKDLHHHYLSIGRHRGYVPFPPRQ